MGREPASGPVPVRWPPERDGAGPTALGLSNAGAKPGRAVAVVVSAMVAAVAIWFLRRPDQLLHPYVWSDEYHVLNAYQAHGLLDAVLSPLKGYFAWPTSFSIGVAAWASFAHLPRVEYWLSTAWFVATIALVLLPRSGLRLWWRAALVVLLALAPMNPEVFGIVLYSFWWTSLWPLLSFTWSEDYWWLRGPALVIGGMSSIAGAALVIPSVLLFALGRRRRDLVATAVLGMALVAQSIAYLTSARSQETPLYPGRVLVQELRNFSEYAFGWVHHPDPAFLDAAGAVLLVAVVVVVAASAARRRSAVTNETVAILVGLLVLGLLSAVPAPLLTSPTANGPRYYFLPFVALAWVLLIVAVTAPWRWARALAAGVIALSLLSLPVDFSRHEPAVNWSAQVARCRTATGPFYVPVQFTGVVSQMWATALVVTPATCHRLGYSR